MTELMFAFWPLFLPATSEWDEDMWHAYNLIQQGDQVRATAVRRIVNESATGSTESHRIKLNLTVQVEKVVFSAASTAANSASGLDSPGATGSSSGEVAALHLSGPVTSESPHVKQGAFHTLDLELNREFTLIKAECEWDSVNLERVQEATQLGGTGQAEVGAIVAGDGVANICLITQHTTLVRQRIDVPVPKKRRGGGTALGAEKATTKFHQQIYAALIRHFDLTQLKCVILASPGFVKEGLFNFIMDEAQRTGNKALLTSKSKFMLLHSPSHHVHALAQLLSSPEVSARLKDTKFAREGQTLEKFNRMLATDELRAWYGEEHVCKAAERGAVGSLLISDALFRCVSLPPTHFSSLNAAIKTDANASSVAQVKRLWQTTKVRQAGRRCERLRRRYRHLLKLTRVRRA